MPLQKVRTSDLEHLYATVTLAPSSVTVLHAVLHRALKIAVRDKLLAINPADAVEDRPRPNKDLSHAAREHCWSVDDARKFLTIAKKAGPQAAAFFVLAIDSGARKSELLGLRWADVDLDAGTVTIARQLEPRSATTTPKWGPPKNGRARVLTLGPDTITQLRKHKQHQRELLMANRTTYRDFGLVLAKEHEHLQKPADELGQPCASLPDGQFRQVAKAAGVKRIKFHGLRHSTATLLLGEGVPIQVVAQRLGHKKTTMTLDVYAHALPDMQRDAAEKLGALLASAG